MTSHHPHPHPRRLRRPRRRPLRHLPGPATATAARSSTGYPEQDSNPGLALPLPVIPSCLPSAQETRVRVLSPFPSHKTSFRVPEKTDHPDHPRAAHLRQGVGHVLPPLSDGWHLLVGHVRIGICIGKGGHAEVHHQHVHIYTTNTHAGTPVRAGQPAVPMLVGRCSHHAPMLLGSGLAGSATRGR